jgi:hypothetical protein
MKRTIELTLKMGELLQSDEFPAELKAAIMRDYTRILETQGQEAATRHMEKLPFQILQVLANFDNRIFDILCEDTYNFLSEGTKQYEHFNAD